MAFCCNVDYAEIPWRATWRGIALRAAFPAAERLAAWTNAFSSGLWYNDPEADAVVWCPIMQSRWFNVAVLTLWVATMSWLVTVKVLPSLLVGDPPSYSQIVEAQKDAPPVGWRMSINHRPLGWALSDTKLQPTGLTDIHGRVHFDALPLDEMIPGWLRALARMIRQPMDQLKMDARSVLTIDSLGNLMRFDSAMRVDPLNEVISVRGVVEGRQLELVVRSGNMSFTNEAFLPSDALLTDALSPQSQLPGLRAGQTWTVPVYSPLWPAKTPLEIVIAKVEGTEPISWNGKIEECWLVVYRNDSGSGSPESQTPRGRLWVRRDGAVLKQQVLLFDSIITFERLSETEAAKLADSAGPQWWNAEGDLRDAMRGEDDPMLDPMRRGGPPFPPIGTRWSGRPYGDSRTHHHRALPGGPGPGVRGDSLSKKKTGSETAGTNDATNGEHEAPAPLSQRAGKGALIPAAAPVTENDPQDKAHD
jgi:hypothetical protein